MRYLISLMILVPSLVFAENPPPRISDEGGTKAPYFNLDCVGAGVACSTSGINATITIPGTLPANGTNCSAASFPLGVDASGNAESCSTSISGNAATATALAANGANCSAGNYPLGVDASGAVETCTADDDVPESGDLAAATLQVVTTSGKTTDVGMTLLDDTNIDFGTSSDISCEYASATEDLECRNTLSDFGVNLDLDFPVDIATTSTTTSGVDQYSALKLSNTVNGYAALTQDYGIDLDVNFDDTTNLNLSGFATALRSEMNISSTGGFPTSASFANLVFSNNFTQPRTYGNTYGVFGTVNTQAAAVFSPSITAFTAGWDDSGGASTTSYYEFYARGISDLGGGPPVATNRYGLYVADGTGTPTLTNNYGVYISALTDGTNDYPLFLAGTAKQFFTDANVTINASSSGNLNLHASSDIDSDQTISFPDNEGTRFGTGNDASMYYDGTDLIVNPQLVGTGVVRIGPSGDEDLIGNRLNFCNTAIDTTAFVKGDCTGTARAALNFKLTKTGANGTLGNTITMVNQTTAVSPNVTGLATTVTSDTTSETGGVYTGQKVIFGSLQDPSGAADVDFIGYQLVPNSFAAYTSDTVNQIGLHMDNLTLPSGASAGALYSGVFEEDLAFTSGRCIEFENSGDGAYTAGDSKFCHDSSDGDLEIFAEGLQVVDYDDDLTQIGDVVAGNYLQVYNATSGTIPEGSWKGVGTALYVVDGDTSAFAYSGDTDARLQFSTTNSFEFRDLGGVSRFNLDVVNGDIEVGTTSRGIDMVTSGNELTIGRVNAGTIVSGALATTVSQSYQTTDPDVTAYQWTVQTTGTDPTIKTEAARITTTDATVTTILTIPIAATSATLIECRVGGIRTGGVAGTAGDGASYVLRCGYRDSAGTTTERTDTIDFTSEDQAGWNTNCAVSGTNALVQVNGATNNNVTWQAWCEYFTVVN